MRSIFILCLLLTTFWIAAEEIRVVNSISQTITSIGEDGVDHTFATLGQFPGAAPNQIALWGEYLLVVITYEHSVEIIHRQTGTLEDRVFLSEGSVPWGIAVAQDMAYVTAGGLNQVACIDLLSRQVTAVLSAGVNPQGVTVHDGKLYVANTGFHLDTYQYDPGTVSVYDTGSLEETAVWNTGLNPQDVMFIQGRLHVACTGDYMNTPGQVDVIDPAAPLDVQTVPTGGTPVDLTHVSGALIYVAHAWPAGISAYHRDDLSIQISPGDGTLVPGNRCARAGERLAVIDAGDYVGNSLLYLYETDTHLLTDTYTLGVGAVDLTSFSLPQSVPEESDPSNSARLLIGPNPLHSGQTARIRFGLKEGPPRKVLIHDIRGRSVRTLPAGRTDWLWDGTDDRGDRVASGVYLFHIEGMDGVAGKCMLIR